MCKYRRRKNNSVAAARGPNSTSPANGDARCRLSASQDGNAETGAAGPEEEWKVVVRKRNKAKRAEKIVMRGPRVAPARKAGTA